MDKIAKIVDAWQSGELLEYEACNRISEVLLDFQYEEYKRNSSCDCGNQGVCDHDC